MTGRVERHIEMETLRDMLVENEESLKDRPSMLFHDEFVSCEQLAQRNNRVANFLLESGASKGDIVSIMVGDRWGYFYLIFGAARIGAVAGPADDWRQEKEITHRIGDSEPVVIAFENCFTLAKSRSYDY